MMRKRSFTVSLLLLILIAFVIEIRIIGGVDRTDCAVSTEKGFKHYKSFLMPKCRLYKLLNTNRKIGSDRKSVFKAVLYLICNMKLFKNIDKI